jgi:hypothetical protein
MKVKTLSVLAGISAPLILTGASNANFVGITIIEKPNAYTNMTWNIYAIFDTPDGPGQAGDLMQAVAGTPGSPLNITVWQDEAKTIPGTFYQNNFGTDKAPSTQLVGVFPSLAYDTFVTIGIKMTPPADQLTLTPTWPGFGPSSLNLTNDGWAVTPLNPQGDPFNPNYVQGNGTILIGQFSSNDAQYIAGQMLIQWKADKVNNDTGDPGPDGILDIGAYQAYVEFNTVPTPGVLGLLGAAGLIACRRRRR